MIVIDTSVAVKWVIPNDDADREQDMDAALSLLAQGLIAPDLIVAEFGNALWKKVRRGEIAAEQAREASTVLPDILSFMPARAYAARALEIALELGHPVYDCFYVAVAEQHDCRLVTADQRLVKRCHASPYASFVGDLAGEHRT